MGVFRKVVNTAKLPHEQWLAYRRMGIGGSDVAKITGHSNYGTMFTTWLDKTGQVPAESEENEYMYWGNVMEPILAKEFERRTGFKVKRVNYLLQSVKHPFMLANLDREIVGQKVGLEIKTASEYLLKQWEGDSVPDAYYLQCQHYMAVTGYESWWIAVLVGGNKFIYKQIARDEDVIARLIDIERDFWSLVETGTMPAVDGEEITSEYIKAKHPFADKNEIALESHVLDIIADIERAEAIKDEVEKTIEARKNEIKLMLGDSERGSVQGRVVVWKNVTSNRVDTKRLKTERPDVWSEFCKESTSRRFEIK